MKNEFNVKGEVVVILVHSKHGEFEVLVDKEDFDRIKNQIGNVHVNKKQGYTGEYFSAKTRIKGNRKCLLLHRVIIGYFAEMDIDHINGNPLDNRKSNLRIVSRSENMQNRKGPNINNNSSKVRNVYWNKKRNKWIAFFEKNGERHYGGGYDDMEEAEKVANNLRVLINNK